MENIGSMEIAGYRDFVYNIYMLSQKGGKYD